MRIHISRSVVPNLFTVLNAFFGFLSILSALQGKFVPACWYIFFSAVCDLLDGFMARLTRSASDFGVQLDSLSDVVSFGVAPSVLLYVLTLYQLDPVGALFAASQLVFGALRLARFNVQLVGYSKEYFTGLSIPVSALTLVSYVLFFGPEQIKNTELLQYLLLGLTLANGLLMVSTIRYPVFPRISKRIVRDKPYLVAGAVAGIVIIAVFRERGIFPILLFLELSGIVAAGYRTLRKQPRGPRARRNFRDDTLNQLKADPHEAS
jgi:CDP-diacylglycerol--serine O-phosphatidyltransferase